MGDAHWTAVDEYLEQALIADDAVGQRVLEAQRNAGLPDIAVSPAQGALLAVLARSVGAERALEFGTLGGYSTLWIARALPATGHVVTFEKSEEHARVARASLDAAGVGHKVTIRVGAALDNIVTLAEDEPFDLVFIDADKPNNVHYYEAAMTRVRPGSLVIVDNVVRQGAIADPADTTPEVEGSRAVISHVAADPRVEATVLQTVGRKGHDGMLLATVL
ncbi:MAG: O-methyltransferase [Actinomycetes bacterium]|nr:MAG: methyltransferase [Actinomycetota bacterium]